MSRSHLVSAAALAATATALSLASAAPPRGGSIPDAQRDPNGYAWTVFAQPNSDPGGAVTALASVPGGLLVAHAPTNAIELADAAGKLTREAQTNYPVGSFSADGAWAAVGARGVGGAGDLWQRGAGQWTVVIDSTAAGSAVVGGAGGELVAGTGDLGQDGAVHLGDRRRGLVQNAATLPGVLPTAVADAGRATWIGGTDSAAGGGKARFFQGRRGRFQEVSLSLPGPALQQNERQEVTALLSVNGTLVAAVAVMDEVTRAPRRGQVLVISGTSAVELGSFPANDAPLSLLPADGSILVGTAAGRLLHLAQGAWVDEPGLPPNQGLLALALDRATGHVYAGTRSQGGASVLVRKPKAPALVPPAAPSNLVAAAPAPTQVDLTWKDNSSDEMAFLIQRAPAGQNTFTQVGMVGPNTSTWSDKTVQPKTGYVYQVIASGPGGASLPSNLATVTTPDVVARLTYLQHVKPILAGDNLLKISCAGCHVGRPYNLSVGLTNDQADYTSTLNYIDRTTPTNSSLLRKAIGNGHPVTLLNVGSTQYNTIVQWIQSGAAYN